MRVPSPKANKDPNARKEQSLLDRALARKRWEREKIQKASAFKQLYSERPLLKLVSKDELGAIEAGVKDLQWTGPDDKDEKAAEFARFVLEDVGARAIPFLVKAISSEPDLLAKERLILTAGSIAANNPTSNNAQLAREAFYGLLDSYKEEVRSAAICALGYYGPDQDPTPFIKMLSDNSRMVAEDTISMMSIHGIWHPDAIPFLFHNLETSEDDHSVWETRRLLISGVYTMTDHSPFGPFVPKLYGMLNNTDPMMEDYRGWSAIMLARIRHSDAEKAITDAIVSEEYKPRMTIREMEFALLLLKDRRIGVLDKIIQLLFETPEGALIGTLGYSISKELARYNETAVECLIPLIKGENGDEFASLASRTLEEMAPKIGQPLVDLLESNAFGRYGPSSYIRVTLDRIYRRYMGREID